MASPDVGEKRPVGIAMMAMMLLRIQLISRVANMLVMMLLIETMKKRRDL